MAILPPQTRLSFYSIGIRIICQIRRNTILPVTPIFTVFPICAILTGQTVCTIFSVLTVNTVPAFQTLQPFCNCPHKTVFRSNLVSRTTVLSICSSLHFGKFFQKLRIQIQSRRNWRIPICNKARWSNVKSYRYGCRTQCGIAFCIVAKQTHLHRTRMQFGRQQTSRSLCAKHYVVCFFALRELYHFVQRFPISIEHELYRNKCDLVRGNDLPLQCFDFLLFH